MKHLRHCRSHNKLVLAFILSVLWMSADAVVAQLSSGNEPAYTIHSTTRRVLLDVVVKDKKGNIITNVKEGDFTVLEDDVPQRITGYDPPNHHEMPDLDRIIVRSTADLAKIGSAPVTILVLDELNTTFEDIAYSRQKMEKYLEAQPAVLSQPTILLVVDDTHFRVLQDYTQDRNLLKDALKKHIPNLPFKLNKSGANSAGAFERMAQSLNALHQVTEASGGTRGRKSIIWVGKGFPSVNLLTLDNDSTLLMQNAIKRLTKELLDCRVTLYTIDPASTIVGQGMVSTTDDLADFESRSDGEPFADEIKFSTLAPATGGQAFFARNDIDNELKDAVQQGANYYSLTYAPTNSLEQDAKYRHIRIKMSNPDLIAVTRDGYYDSDDTNKALESVTNKAKDIRHDLEAEMGNAALGGLAYNGLTVGLEKGEGDILHLMVVAGGLIWKPTSDQHMRAEITVLNVAFSSKGKVLSHTSDELFATVKGIIQNPDQNAVFNIHVPQPTGTARVRVVVRDALSGKIGTAEMLF